MIADIIKKLKEGVITEHEILKFFTLFETDNFIEGVNSEDFGVIMDMKSKDLKVNLFMPFMKFILGKDKQLKEYFIQECLKRIHVKDKSHAHARILEIFLYNSDTHYLESVIQGHEKSFFHIFYSIMKEERYYSDFFPYGFEERVDTIFHLLIKKKVHEVILADDFNELFLLSQFHFLKGLTQFDAIHLILDPSLDLYNYIITETSKRHDLHKIFEYGIDFPITEGISQFSSKMLVKILEEKNDEKTNALLGLAYHRFIHFRDFLRLSEDVKIHFFVTAHEHVQNYHDGFRDNIDWQLGQLKVLESHCIYQYLIDTIKKDDIEVIHRLFVDGWFNLLRWEDFISLWDEINLLDVLMNVNRYLDFDTYDYGLSFNTNHLEFVKDKVRKGLIKMLQNIEEKDLKILFLTDLIKYVPLSDFTLLFDNVHFILQLFHLERVWWEYGSDSIHDFVKTYKDLLRIKLKPIIIKILKEGDLRQVFNIWDYGWLNIIPEVDLIELLSQPELHLFEKIMEALHFHAFEKNYDHTRALFPLMGHFIIWSEKKRNAFKTPVIEVIKSGKFEAIIPLIGTHYLNVLDIDELMSLIKDPSVKLLDLIKKAMQDHEDEIYYFSSMFFNWVDRFNVLLYNFGLHLMKRSWNLIELIHHSRPQVPLHVRYNWSAEENEHVTIAGKKFRVYKGELFLQNLFIQDLTKISGLFQLKTINSLDLSFNWIINLPEEIERLQSLETIKIIDSHLQSLPESIGRLPHLRILDIQGNYMRKLPESLLASGSLEEVRLSRYQYDKFPILDKMIDELKQKGVKVHIHKMNFLG